MPESPLFSSTAQAWTPRPGDPNDTFLAELVETAAPPAEDGAARGEVALFGVPYDGAVPSRPGARAGPDAIRAELAKLKPWGSATGAFAPRVRDWGNVRVPYGDVGTVLESVESAALAVLDRGAFPLVLGGDHSITFPLAKAHEGRVRKMGVINFDAHLDVRDVVDGRLNSGQSFGRLLDLGFAPGENLVEIGIRDYGNSAKYVEKARKAGATVFTAMDWRDGGMETVRQAVEIASDGVDGVYLSVDMDVLDQAHAPGVSAPTPGGPDSIELLRALCHVAGKAPLVGVDFVEVAPFLDRDGQTCRATAYAVMEVLAGIVRSGRLSP